MDDSLHGLRVFLLKATLQQPAGLLVDQMPSEGWLATLFSKLH